MIWTGIVNYFILKKLWKFGGDDDNTVAAPGSTSSFNGDTIGARKKHLVNNDSQMIKIV
eukprot:CAMPEP_0171314220 /NCGR_PEP_ID=MMETSP0816-20121228/49972_1 /TAXON_ID=420281 /ORGANISM="Proboscia inermis, Strain CCAP1064/1" /LENGTH=58 /DNA_ID=CAMNT_0011802837 /DNA_START=233 /DNA_END=409 /DNA_ORIENTATION=-